MLLVYAHSDSKKIKGAHPPEFVRKL